MNQTLVPYAHRRTDGVKVLNLGKLLFSARSRVQNLVGSLSTVTFMITLAIAIIIGVIIFKASMVIVIYDWNLPLVDVLGGATVTSLIGSCINACCIIILEKIYGVIAWYLTKKEYPRSVSWFPKE